MTFTNAIQNIRNGEAVKRESWIGYVLKQEAADSTIESPKYDIVFVHKDGSRNVFPFGTETAESQCSLNKDLLASFMADDWIRGSADEFEKARTGTSGDF